MNPAIRPVARGLRTVVNFTTPGVLVLGVVFIGKTGFSGRRYRVGMTSVSRRWIRRCAAHGGVRFRSRLDFAHEKAPVAPGIGGRMAGASLAPMVKVAAPPERARSILWPERTGAIPWCRNFVGPRAQSALPAGSNGGSLARGGDQSVRRASAWFGRRTLAYLEQDKEGR